MLKLRNIYLLSDTFKPHRQPKRDLLPYGNWQFIFQNIINVSLTKHPTQTHIRPALKFFGPTFCKRDMHKPCEHLRGRGVNQMTILLQKPFLINVTTKGEGGQKYPKFWPRGLWMTEISLVCMLSTNEEILLCRLLLLLSGVTIFEVFLKFFVG